MTMDIEPLLRVRDLSIEFRTARGWVNVVDRVSLDLSRRRTLALVGESGSGKTVTSLGIMGLVRRPNGRVAAGSVRYQGADLLSLSQRELSRVRGQEIAMIFQEPRRSLDPSFTIGEQIAESVRAHRGVSRRAAWARAIEMLDLVQIPQAARRVKEYPHTFSGGMCQRVMLAAALASQPNVLIADEPTTALDVTVQARILDLIKEIQQQMGLAVLFITHDLGVVADMSDDVAVMYAGQVVERRPVVDLFEAPRHPYTEGLLASLPEANTRAASLHAIPGAVPPPHEWPAGCHFAARCPHTVAACTDAPVELRTLGDGAARCIRIPVATAEATP